VASILPFPQTDEIVLQFTDRCFDDEATATICQAFDKVCWELHDWGQPQTVRDVIAKRLIAIAGRGERDPDKMCAAALISFGMWRAP
jgi:hypothetical protein